MKELDHAEYERIVLYEQNRINKLMLEQAASLAHAERNKEAMMDLQRQKAEAKANMKNKG